LNEQAIKAFKNSKNQFSGYVGFDPTAKNIHFGNYLQLLTLTHLALEDIQPIILIGGATG